MAMQRVQRLVCQQLERHPRSYLNTFVVLSTTLTAVTGFALEGARSVGESGRASHRRSHRTRDSWESAVQVRQ